MIIDTAYQITALGKHTPARKLTNADLERMVDTNDEWIVKRTGIRERFLASEEEFASDLAIRAVEDLIENTGASVADADVVLVSALVPDHLTPSVAALVSGRFGIRGAGTFDLHAACSGFAYGMITANAYLAGGLAKKVLLIAAETLSKAVDYTDRGTCILFGDAAVAMLIERASDNKRFAFTYGTDGDLADKVYLSAFSPSVNGVPVEKPRVIRQNGQALYTYVVRTITERITALMDEARLTPADIDWFIPHSANLRMIDAMRERLGFAREQMLTSVERYGNTSSASIPLALIDAVRDGRVQRGDKVLIYGFGGGLTHAGAIFEW